MASSSESSRFQHLLQPIRDLGKNWNIDLAQELEEYLEELESLTIAFDADAMSAAASSAPAMPQLMNFAEAALLIQGTSMIYSRKVEYLYALVFQTLAHLSKQQDDGRGRQPGEHDAAHGDGDDADADDAGDAARGGSHLDLLANPLPIVERVEEAKHITLKRRDAAGVQSRAVGLRNSMQASIALMGPLLPDERDHGETFKLLSSNLHPSGVLLLDEASKKYLEPLDEALAISASQQSRANATRAATALDFDGLRDDASALQDGGADDDDEHDDNDYDEQPMADDDSAGFDYGGGDDHDDQRTGPAAEQDAVDPFLADSAAHYDAVQSDAAAATSAPTSPSASKVSRKKMDGLSDPWAPLDPYDASKSTVRAFRKGRTYSKAKGAQLEHQRLKQRLKKEEPEADGVDDPAFKDRFLLRANRPQWSTWVWTELDERALEAKFRKKYCKAPCLMKSCDALWRMETKWKALLQRSLAAEAQSAQAILLQEQAEEEEQQLHEMTSRPTGGDLLDDPLFAASSNDVGGGAGDGIGGGADDNDDDDDDDDMDAGGFDTGYEDAGVEFGDASAAWAPSGDVDDGERPLSYEEICRQHLEAFMRGTEQYIRETDLTRQVSDWQDKLAPILKEQDRHPPFDIHRYGKSILENLEIETSKVADDADAAETTKRSKKAKSKAAVDDADRPTVPFDALVGGLQQFEVCRMFLASLQLANNGNVHLVHAQEAAEQDAVPFQMQLLSTANVYEAIQTS
ncbi:hypothetical protein ATCC90586_004704 [Pythium insidiosum]|nr:hypothetical protein ATCC90586_004704 [Pythium insidiosum]